MVQPQTLPVNPVMTASAGGRQLIPAHNDLGLSLLRVQLLELLAADVFTTDEYDRAMINIYNCQDALRLQRWYRNVTRVKQQREAVATGTHLSVVVDQSALAEQAESGVGSVIVAATAVITTVEKSPRLALAVAQRIRRGRTSDHAAEESAWRREAEFSADTGLSWEEAARL